MIALKIFFGSLYLFAIKIKVEIWLNGLTDIMRTSGRQYFKKAVKSYDNKPRKLWIFDYPAQTALCGIQIWWTSEINDTFVQMELGHENALKDYNKKQVKSIILHKYSIKLIHTTIKFMFKDNAVERTY